MRRPRNARTRSVRWCLALGALLLAAGCSGDEAEPTIAPTTRTPTTPATASPSETPPPTPTVEPGPVVPSATFEDVVTGLDVPWGLAFLPDESALVSERDTGRILAVTASSDVAEVGTVPGVDAAGEGGLLGLAVDPAAPTSVYAYFTAADDNRVVRMPLQNGALGDPVVVIDGIPKAVNHNGGRMTFGPDGMLYVSTGDAGAPSRAQDLDSLGGKILRLQPDGSVPADNPFDGSPVFSYGHRNVQGLAFDDAGQLWASEFGQQRWDELNLIQAGSNYGWPIVEGIGGDDRFVEPVAQWSTDDASPSGIAYVRDTVFLAALRGQRLWQVPVPGGEAGSPTDFFVGEFGRLRHAALAPDGSLWLLTGNTDGRNPDGPREGDDRILRVTLEPQA
ncbi:MAG TPA: PQQ-dependent sugar dehydrogenase [Jiangellaceae bacterium]|nr:PQQ-dependent sugar dehydrogenase [Jiangellaceae bacterium]